MTKQRRRRKRRVKSSTNQAENLGGHRVSCAVGLATKADHSTRRQRLG